MQDSRPGKDNSPNDLYPRTGRCELMVSDDLILLHDPAVQEGKTRDMAKGLFLCCRGESCAGESAGLGLPVWKTRNQTFFPTLVSMEYIRPTTIRKDFCMDRVIKWRRSGKEAPVWFPRAMEILVDWYMRRPAIQQRMLRLRDRLLSACRLESAMVQGAAQGFCRVHYNAEPQGMVIQVDGSSLHGQGKLIMLNEVDGVSFNRVVMDDLVWTDGEIPAWREACFETILESTRHGVGFSLSPGLNGDSTGAALYCGREVAAGLNWSGLAFISGQQVLAYRINFRRTDGLEVPPL
jgi:hypothetical protein